MSHTSLVRTRRFATRTTSPAAQPARAVQAAKRALRGARSLPLAAGLDLERSSFEHVLAISDAREGVAAYLERRSPSFSHA